MVVEVWWKAPHAITGLSRYSSKTKANRPSAFYGVIYDIYEIIGISESVVSYFRRYRISIRGAFCEGCACSEWKEEALL